MDSSKAAALWDKRNTKGYYIKLQIRTDKDIIELLDRIGNRQGYIKQLIRDDLDGEKKYQNFLK